MTDPQGAAEPSADAGAPAPTRYVLRLCVTGTTPLSARAIVNVRRLCEEHRRGGYELEVVDIGQNPALAASEQIVALPTLIKLLLLPLRRFIDDMSQVDGIRYAGAPAASFFHRQDPSRGRHAGRPVGAMERGVGRGLSWRAKRPDRFQFTTPDGDVRNLDARLIPEFAADGSVESVLSVATDVTERARAEEALRQADERKDEFLATLAHELRNPLAPIVNALAILGVSKDP